MPISIIILLLCQATCYICNANEKHIIFWLLSNTRVFSSTVQLKYFLCWANAGKFYEYFYTLQVSPLWCCLLSHLEAYLWPIYSGPTQHTTRAVKDFRKWLTYSTLFTHTHTHTHIHMNTQEHNTHTWWLSPSCFSLLVVVVNTEGLSLSAELLT